MDKNLIMGQGLFFSKHPQHIIKFKLTRIETSQASLQAFGGAGFRLK